MTISTEIKPRMSPSLSGDSPGQAMDMSKQIAGPA
jgi:hypothetical protein